MRLLTITHYNDNEIMRYVELDDVYAEFRLVKGGNPYYLTTFPKANTPGEYGQTLRFRDYEHFVGVFSKFMPETSFLEHPVEIERLDFQELTELCATYPWFKNNG